MNSDQTKAYHTGAAPLLVNAVGRQDYDNAVGETPDTADASDQVAAALRWIPLVAPLLAGLLALDTFVILWAVVAPH